MDIDRLGNSDHDQGTVYAVEYLPRLSSVARQDLG
jgi:hypothetical protein